MNEKPVRCRYCGRYVLTPCQNLCVANSCQNFVLPFLETDND